MLGEQRRIVLAGLAATEERGSILRLHDGLTANGRGISGGGPHVLACVALLPERVVAAASLASLAAYDGEVLDSFDGMGEGSTQDSKLYVEHGREAGRADAEQQAEAQGDAAVPEPVAMMSAFHRRRREGAHGGPGDFLLSGTQHGLSPGTEVWLDEDMVRPRALTPTTCACRCSYGRPSRCHPGCPEPTVWPVRARRCRSSACRRPSWLLLGSLRRPLMRNCHVQAYPKPPVG